MPASTEVLARAGVVDRVLAESEHLRFARLFDAELRPVNELAYAGADCLSCVPQIYAVRPVDGVFPHVNQNSWPIGLHQLRNPEASWHRFSAPTVSPADKAIDGAMQTSNRPMAFVDSVELGTHT